MCNMYSMYHLTLYVKYVAIIFDLVKIIIRVPVRKTHRGSRSVFRTRANNRVTPIRKWKSRFGSLFRETDRQITIGFSKKGPGKRFPVFEWEA